MSLRVTPPDAAGGVPWADASVAINPVIAQIAQDAKPRLLSMVASLFEIVFRCSLSGTPSEAEV